MNNDPFPRKHTTTEEFLKSRPCLEEIEGFRDGLRIQEVRLSADEMEPLLRYESDLRTGKTIPAPSRMQRAWIYKSKRNPTKRR